MVEQKNKAFKRKLTNESVGMLIASAGHLPIRKEEVLGRILFSYCKLNSSRFHPGKFPSRLIANRGNRKEGSLRSCMGTVDYPGSLIKARGCDCIPRNKYFMGILSI